MNILNEFAIGLTSPKRYKELLSVKLWHTVIYAIVIISLGSVMVLKATTQLKGILGEFYEKSVPDFTFSDKRFTITEPFELNLYGILIRADSSAQFTKDDMNNAICGYLLDNDSVVIRSGRNTVEASYDEIFENSNPSFTKQTLYSYAPLMDKIFNIVAIFGVIYSVAGFFFGVLVVAMIFLLVNRKAGLRFPKLFKLALYSRGLPIIISWILSHFIYPLPVFFSIAISCVFMNIAILNIIKEQFLKNHPTTDPFGPEK